MWPCLLAKRFSSPDLFTAFCIKHVLNISVRCSSSHVRTLWTTATHQFQLHDAHTVSEDVGGRPQQLGESIQSVVFKGRAGNLKARQTMAQWNHCK